MIGKEQNRQTKRHSTKAKAATIQTDDHCIIVKDSLMLIEMHNGKTDGSIIKATNGITRSPRSDENEMVAIVGSIGSARSTGSAGSTKM